MINFGVSEQKRNELEKRMQSCNLHESDLEEKFVHSGGAGGQKVNKTSSCVYLKHIPTGLSVKVQTSRSQQLNRFYARRQLCELLENKTLGKDSPQAKKNRENPEAKRPPTKKKTLKTTPLDTTNNTS
jgi:protein subunit release factor B